MSASISSCTDADTAPWSSLVISAEIDEAVLYGFKKAAFFNKQNNAVSGKFTYRFGR